MVRLGRISLTFDKENSVLRITGRQYLYEFHGV